MNRDINKIFIKILVEIIFLVIVIIIGFGFSKNIVNAREKMINIQDSLSIDVIEKSDYLYLFPISDQEACANYDSTILEVSNISGNTVNYDLVLKMNMIEDINNYKVMISGNIYLLNELEYYEDDEYRYFILGNYMIGNKSQNFTFLLWLSDELDDYENADIKYSFLVVEGYNEL